MIASQIWWHSAFIPSIQRQSGVAPGAPVQSELQVKPYVKKLSSIFFIVFLIIFFPISNQ